MPERRAPVTASRPPDILSDFLRRVSEISERGNRNQTEGSTSRSSAVGATASKAAERVKTLKNWFTAVERCLAGFGECGGVWECVGMRLTTLPCHAKPSVPSGTQNQTRSFCRCEIHPKPKP